MSDDLNLRIIGVASGEATAGAQQLTLHTTRGPIPMIFHAAAQPANAILCVSGAMGGVIGPAGLYARLGDEMPARGISVARIDYRDPNEFGECVLDAMAGLSFLRGTGHQAVMLIGHSFGGAVAINAGTLAPQVRTVIAISSQLAGAHVVGELAPRALLIVHGTADMILSHESGQAIFERANEPKRLELIAGADHRFSEHSDRLYEVVSDWLATHLS